MLALALETQLSAAGLEGGVSMQHGIISLSFKLKRKMLLSTAEGTGPSTLIVR
jgi:hypothetical protein